MNYNELIFVKINDTEPEIYFYGKMILEGKLNVVEKAINIAIETYSTKNIEPIKNIEFIVNSWKRNNA